MVHRELQIEFIIKMVGLVLIPLDDVLPGEEGAASETGQVEQVRVSLPHLPLRGHGEFPAVPIDEHLIRAAHRHGGLEPPKLLHVPLPVIQLGGNERHRVLVRHVVEGGKAGAARLAQVAVRQPPVAEQAALVPTDGTFLF